MQIEYNAGSPRNNFPHKKLTYLDKSLQSLSEINRPPVLDRLDRLDRLSKHHVVYSLWHNESEHCKAHCTCKSTKWKGILILLRLQCGASCIVVYHQIKPHSVVAKLSTPSLRGKCGEHRSLEGLAPQCKPKKNIRWNCPIWVQYGRFDCLFM